MGGAMQLASSIRSTVQQPCLGFSRYYIQVLRIPRLSTLAYLIHLTNAFLISSFFHILSVGTMAKGYYPIRSLISDICIFFMLQPVGANHRGHGDYDVSRYVWAAVQGQAAAEQGAENGRDGDAFDLSVIWLRVGNLLVLCDIFLVCQGICRHENARLEDPVLDYAEVDITGRVRL
jgi:hypothetical protein